MAYGRQKTGNINTNRTIFLIISRITGNRRNQPGPLRKGQYDHTT
jgi:hypothetical protein